MKGWLDKYQGGGDVENSFDNVKESQLKPINQGTVNSIKNEIVSYINSPLYAQRQAMHPEEYLGNSEYNYKDPKFFQESAADAKRSYRMMDLMNQPSEIKNIGTFRDYYDPTKKKTVLNKSNLDSVVAHELGHSLFTKHDVAEMYSDYDNSKRWDALSSGTEKPFLTSLNKAEVKKFKDFAYPIKNWDEHYDKDMWGQFANESYADLTGIRHLLYKNGITKSFGEKINRGILDKALKVEQIKNDPTFKRMQQKYSPGKIILLNNTIAQNDSPQQEITQAEDGAELNYNDYSVSAPEGYVGDGTFNEGRDYSPAWGGQFQMGGSLPGATGHMYARYEEGGLVPGDVGFSYSRTINPAPDNGPGAKKTMASAQNGTVLSKAINQLYNSEDAISKWLGNPMQKATFAGKQASLNAFGPHNDAIDNYRHPMAGRYTSEAIQDKLGNIPVLSQTLGFVGSNILGAGHELSSLIGDAPVFGGTDDRPWSVKLRESGEDIFNNMVGAGIGSTPFMTPKQKSELLLNLSLNNKLPDGYGQGDMYIKKRQNGGKMSYYQNGLDFEPKSIGKNGKVIKDDMGQWAHPGEITEIGSNQITMQGVPYPVLGISDTGDMQMMYPDQEYEYDGESVTEYPMMKEGGALQLVKLDQLSNFTNYNTKQPGGWLDKYQ